MPKQVDLEELTKAIDASLEGAQEARESSYMARAMLDIVRPGHIWRAKERTRGTSPSGILEGLCNVTIQLVASELADIDTDDDRKVEIINAFLQAAAEGLGERLGKIPTGIVPERDVGHA